MCQPRDVERCRVVTRMNGPKVNSLPTVLVTVRIEFGYMLENPSIRPVLVLDFGRGQLQSGRCGKPAGKADTARLGYWFCRRRRVLLYRLRSPEWRTRPKRLQD